MHVFIVILGWSFWTGQWGHILHTDFYRRGFSFGGIAVLSITDGPSSPFQGHWYKCMVAVSGCIFLCLGRESGRQRAVLPRSASTGLPTAGHSFVQWVNINPTLSLGKSFLLFWFL